MSEFINVLGVRIRKSIIKKYYADERNVVVTVLYNEKEGNTISDVQIPHNGKAQQAINLLDEIFVYMQ